ncbi:DEAD/DEAH box helicase, partial [Candidatus Babeliales bacterium]|nr:DEAD/DEAH box helicase [Candidatus Babeliales bacterium]
KSAIPTWKTECASQTPDLLSHMILVPYSQLHHIVHRVKYADIRLICYDEVHYLKSPDTKRVRDLANLLEAIGSVNGKFEYGRTITMTGTPMPNGAHELYTTWVLCTSPNLVEAASRLRDEEKFKQWKTTFSQRKERVFMKYNAKLGKKVENSGSTHQGVANEEMLNQLLKEFVHFVRTEDCMDLPESVDNYIDLELEDDKLLEDADIDKPEAYMAILERLARAKAPYMFEWVKDFLAAGSEQLIVFSSYTKPIRQLKEKFKKDVTIITGAEDDYERAESILAFQQGKIRVLAMSYKCGSESLNLQNAQHSLYAGFPWHRGALDQAMARTKRGGQKHTTFHNFLMSGFNDQNILRMVRKKGQATDKVENLLLDNSNNTQNNIINSLDELL